MFIFNRRSLFSLISCAVEGIYTSYNYAFLSIVLSQTFNVPDSSVGFIFAIPCLAYAISSICVGFCIKKLPRRVLILISFIMTTVALLLLGPS